MRFDNKSFIEDYCNFIIMYLKVWYFSYYDSIIQHLFAVWINAHQLGMSL